MRIRDRKACPTRSTGLFPRKGHRPRRPPRNPPERSRWEQGHEEHHPRLPGPHSQNPRSKAPPPGFDPVGAGVPPLPGNPLAECDSPPIAPQRSGVLDQRGPASVHLRQTRLRDDLRPWLRPWPATRGLRPPPLPGVSPDRVRPHDEGGFIADIDGPVPSMPWARACGSHGGQNRRADCPLQGEAERCAGTVTCCS